MLRQWVTVVVHEPTLFPKENGMEFYLVVAKQNNEKRIDGKVATFDKGIAHSSNKVLKMVFIRSCFLYRQLF